MGLFKMAAVGTLGYFAYRALQRKQAGKPSIGNDRDETTDQDLVSDVSDTPSATSQNNLHGSLGSTVS